MTSSTEPAFGHDRDGGWILVTTLWVMVILSLFAVSLQMLVVASARFEAHTLKRARAEMDLDAGVVLGVTGLASGEATKRWRPDGRLHVVSFDGQKLRVSVQDQLGLIDLNEADGSVLRALMINAGEASPKATVLADRILDWRSREPFEHLHGASVGQYQAAGLSYRPRHGAFARVSELKLVLGMSRALFKRIAPALTVYSGRPMIDPAFAPPLVLRAYYGYNAAAVRQVIAERKVVTSSRAKGRYGNGLDFDALRGRTYAIDVVIKEQRMHLERRVVILFTGSPNMPYIVLSWE